MSNSAWWAQERVWKQTAIWATAISLVVLIILTFDTLSQTAVGSKRVPAFTTINHQIDYVFNQERGYQVPVIGKEAPLFGKKVNDDEALALIEKGKLTIQAKNCMNCHTILGNGAYYAPDLTKAWLDPNWVSPELREDMMVAFLLDPPGNARNTRKMPNLAITEEEARGVVAYLKWMSAIDTNGFPANFTSIEQGG